MSGTRCFICGRLPADPNAAIVVNLKSHAAENANKIARVSVPACTGCRRAETGAERRGYVIALVTMLAPAVVLGLAAGWQGALLGLGAGFFASIAVKAFVTNRGRSLEYPPIKQMEKEGWHVDWGPH